MKAKKFLAAIALALTATTFAACTNSDNAIDFSPYWNSHWNVSEKIDETLEYDVTFEKGTPMTNINYELDYTNGLYTTHLVEDPTKAGFYTYTTTLEITAVYTYKSEVKELTDSVVSTVTFSMNDGFAPIKSEKWIVSHSPANATVSRVTQAYDEFHRHVLTDYTGEDAVCKVWDSKPNSDGTANEKLLSEETFSGKSGKHSYIDNEQLLLALRCISTSVDSAKVKVYSPFTDETQKIKLSFEDEDESMEVSYFDYTANPDATEKVKKAFDYRSVTMKLSSSNPGATQTAYIATYDNPEMNTSRNVMLKLETPLAYNLGTLVYSLKSINRIKQ